MFYRKNFNRKFSNGLSLILLGFFFLFHFIYLPFYTTLFYTQIVIILISDANGSFLFLGDVMLTCFWDFGNFELCTRIFLFSTCGNLDSLNWWYFLPERICATDLDHLIKFWGSRLNKGVLLRLHPLPCGRSKSLFPHYSVWIWGKYRLPSLLQLNVFVDFSPLWWNYYF